MPSTMRPSLCHDRHVSSPRTAANPSEFQEIENHAVHLLRAYNVNNASNTTSTGFEISKVFRVISPDIMGAMKRMDSNACLIADSMRPCEKHLVMQSRISDSPEPL